MNRRGWRIYVRNRRGWRSGEDGRLIWDSLDSFVTHLGLIGLIWNSFVTHLGLICSNHLSKQETPTWETASHLRIQRSS